jgi:GNAT superfamily N-acetyltransferase
MFSRTVTDYWLPGAVADAATTAGGYRVITDGSLPDNISLMTLETSGGGRFLTLTSAQGRCLGLTDVSTVSVSALRSALEAAGGALNGADYLFYLPVDDQAAVRAETVPGETRQLTLADAEAFAEFAVAAPAEDMDEASVELDHWLVFGTFADGRLASAASMYPWRGTGFADLGITTLPEYRGRGLAKRTVRAISARALAEGYEPQYRCQLDNTASASLARAAGFAQFGLWDVIVSGNCTGADSSVTK